MWNLAPMLMRQAASANADASVIARMATPPDAARRQMINQLWSQLTSAGIAAKLDLFYLPAAHDAQAALLNWAQAAYDLIPINSPSFTVDRGINGDGVTSYYDTGFNYLGVAAPQYGKDAASAGIYVNSTLVHSGHYDFGQSRAWINAGYASNSFRVAPNGSASSTGAISGNTGQGMTGWMRETATSIYRCRDAVVTGPLTHNSNNIFNVTYLLGALNNTGGVVTGYGARRMACAWAGGFLTVDEYTTLQAAVRAYLEAIGAA